MPAVHTYTVDKVIKQVVSAISPEEALLKANSKDDEEWAVVAVEVTREDRYR